MSRNPQEPLWCTKRQNLTLFPKSDDLSRCVTLRSVFVEFEEEGWRSSVSPGETLALPPLVLAARRGKAAVVRLFLDSGASVNGEKNVCCPESLLSLTDKTVF